MIGDTFLNYFALEILLFVAVVLFYGIIAIHDIPYVVAKSRDHPHRLLQDDAVLTVIRLLSANTLGPTYHLQGPDGTLRLVHESQLAAAGGEVARRRPSFAEEPLWNRERGPRR
jgi:hypothetical protein